jgi:hypothetical protein
MYILYVLVAQSMYILYVLCGTVDVYVLRPLVQSIYILRGTDSCQAKHNDGLIENGSVGWL